MNQPDPTFPSARVQHVAVIDLTGDYYDRRTVLDDFYEQTRFIPQGAHIRVLLGESAISAAPLDLEMQIGRHFAFAASVDIEIPGGSRWGRFIAENVARHVKQARAAEAEYIAQLPPTGTG